jgi:hypothetical protein
LTLAFKIIKVLDIVLCELWDSLSLQVSIDIVPELPLLVLIEGYHCDGISILDNTFSTGTQSLASLHQSILFGLGQADLIKLQYLEKSVIW